MTMKQTTTHHTQGTDGGDSVSVNDIRVDVKTVHYKTCRWDRYYGRYYSLERFSTHTRTSEKDENKLSEACENGERSDSDEDNTGEGQENGAIDALPVDDNLFTGEDVDEPEELNTLDL